VFDAGVTASLDNSRNIVSVLHVDMGCSGSLTIVRRAVLSGTWLLGLVPLFALHGTGCTGAHDRPADDRPNILFILTDDQRWDAVGYAGNRVLETPNLDHLAAEGARLDRFYVASAVCQPSRANFLTGRYNHERPIVPKTVKLAPTMRTIGHHLARAGYVTGFIGKPHLGGDPTVWGFQEIPAIIQDGRGAVKRVDPALLIDGRRQTVKGLVTEIFADAAIDFIERNQDRPWFLWFATSVPHVPYHMSEEYPYSEEDVRRYPPPGWPPDQRMMVHPTFANWRAYYSMIEMLDAQIGRVLGRLDALGLYANTVVIFTSDNGVMHGSHGYLFKGLWFEESSRVPAIVRWPGRIEAGAVHSSLASSVDVLPTILDIAGLPAPEDLEGRTLLPLLMDGQPVRTYAYAQGSKRPGEGGGRWQMVARDQWKYVEFVDREERFLFDLDSDPHEGINLVDSAEHEQTARELRRALVEWRASPWRSVDP
jgi:arylsulfatase A-like enzyme